jgi:hypothetical protein
MPGDKRKKKAGRPPKPLGEKWIPATLVRVPPEELKVLRAEAKSAGMSVAGYLLACWRRRRE